jgi:hypothetical protein
MRIKHVTPVIVKRYLNPKVRKRALFLLGPAGIGKSEVVFQASEFLKDKVEDWHGVVDIRLSQMEPTDLRGIPAADMANKVATWCRFDTLPQEGSGIIFLDEITSAPQSIQAAAYQLVLTPQDFGVPEGWMIMAAGNSKSDRGVTYNIGGPLLNRFNQVEVASTLDDFEDHAITQGIRPEVLSFLRDRPDYLHKFEPTGGEIKPFPTPRSWFAVSDALSLDLPEEVRPECIKGDIGEEAGIAFEAHLRVYGEMPRIDDILEGKPTEVPEKLNVLYCVAMGLATRLDKSNFDNAWKFLQKCPGDVQTLTVKLAYKRDKDLAKSPAFTQWSLQNQGAFNA